MERGKIVDFLTSGPTQSLFSIFLLAVILWISYRVGQAFFLGLRLPVEILLPIERVSFSLGFGMLVVSALIFFLGITGFLTRFTAILILFSLFGVVEACLRNHRTNEWNCEAALNYLRKNSAFCSVVLGIFFLALIQALAPPIGNDALAYHLYHAKEFVLRHRIEYLPYSRESLWPYFTETFFMLGLLLEGTILATLFHWIFYLLTSALVYSFGRRFFDERTARIALIVFIFTPVAFAQSGHAYVDLTLAFFVFAGVYAFLLFDRYKNDKLFMLSGALIGGAVATKYLGLGAFFILTFLVVVKTRFRFKSLLYFIVSAFAVSGFWYIHSWLSIGNPVYPFFPRFFNGHGFQFNIAENVGMGNDFFAFLKLPWNMTMHPRNFGGEMIGPLFLMFAPFAFLTIKKARKTMLYLAVFGILYTAFLFTQSQHLRFYLSIAPILSIAAAVGIKHLAAEGFWIKKSAITVLASVVFLHFTIFIYRTRNIWPVAIGKISAQKYLLKYERSYEGYQFFRDHLKKNERYFNAAEVRYFYNTAGDRMIYDSMPLRLDLKGRQIPFGEYAEKEKFDYIWLLRGTAPDVWDFAQTHDYRKVYDYKLIEKPHTFDYEIFQRIEKAVS